MGKLKDLIIDAMENEDMTYDEAVDYANSILRSFGDKDMGRQNANREIVKILSGMVEAYPDQRFVQLLSNLEIIEPEQDSTGFHVIGYKDFYAMESTETLERIKKAVIKMGESG